MEKQDHLSKTIVRACNTRSYCIGSSIASLRQLRQSVSMMVYLWHVHWTVTIISIYMYCKYIPNGGKKISRSCLTWTAIPTCVLCRKMLLSRQVASQELLLLRELRRVLTVSCRGTTLWMKAASSLDCPSFVTKI